MIDGAGEADPEAGLGDLAHRLDVAGAERLGDQRGDGADDADGGELEGEEERVGERAGGDVLRAEHAHDDEIGGPERVLRQLGEDQRPGEDEQRAQLRAPGGGGGGRHVERGGCGFGDGGHFRGVMGRRARLLSYWRETVNPLSGLPRYCPGEHGGGIWTRTSGTRFCGGFARR